MNFASTVDKKCYAAHKKLWRSQLSVDSKASKVLRAIKTVQVNIYARNLIGIYAIFNSSSLHRYFKIPHLCFGYDLRKQDLYSQEIKHV